MTTEAAYKAQDYRLFQFGPDDNKRVWRMGEWTRNNPGRPRCENPFSPPRYFNAPQLAKAIMFAKWERANRGQPHAENPYGWFKPGTVHPWWE